MSSQIPTIGTLPKKERQEIRTQFRRLAEFKSLNQNIFIRAETLIEKLFDKQTPKSEFGDAGYTFVILHYAAPEAQAACGIIASIMKNFLVASYPGEERNIITVQEHRIYGSSGMTRAKDLYMPVDLIEKKLSIDEVRFLREFQMTIPIMPKYYGLSIDEWSGKMGLLEPLNETGRTIRDPRLIDMGKIKVSFMGSASVEEVIEASLVKNVSKSADFPGKRD